MSCSAPSSADVDSAWPGLSFFPDQRQQEGHHLFPGVYQDRCAPSRDRGNVASSSPFLKRLSHANRSGSWNTASTAASTSFIHPSLADIHCYWKQSTTDLTKTKSGNERREGSQEAQQISCSRLSSPSPAERRVNRDNAHVFSKPSPFGVVSGLHRSPSEPLQFLQSWARSDPNATSEVLPHQRGCVLHDRTWLGSADAHSGNTRQVPLETSCGPHVESRDSVTLIPSGTVTASAHVPRDAPRCAPFTQSIAPQKAELCRQRKLPAGSLCPISQPTSPRGPGSGDSIQRIGFRANHAGPGARFAFQAIAALKAIGSGTVHPTRVRPHSQPEPVEHTLVKLRVSSEGARRTCIHRDASKLDGSERSCSPSSNPQDIRDSLSEPVFPIAALGQLLEDTECWRTKNALSRGLQAVPRKLLPFQSSTLQTFLSTWRHIASERQILRRLSSDAKHHRSLKILRHAFLALRMHAHTTTQLRIKGEICHLEAVAHIAQRHFLAWLRIHYATSARKAFLKTFGLRAFRAGVVEGRGLTAVGEAAYYKSVKFRVLRGFAGYRLAQLQAREREANATGIYTISLLKKGLKGWCKWHAYIGACTKLLIVASQLEEARRRETLCMVLRIWREATTRAAAEHARSEALSRPWRLKALIRGWRRWTQLSSLMRMKRRENQLKNVVAAFHRWKGRFREHLLTEQAVQKGIRAILRDKEKILLSTALCTWRSFACGRALASRAYNSLVAKRTRRWFSELRQAAFLRAVQRQIGRANATRYAHRVLCHWHRLSRQRKRERFVFRCLLDARESALYSAAWATWRQVTLAHQRATKFCYAYTTKKALASWKGFSRRRRHLRKTSAELFVKSLDARKRQPFLQWFTLAITRRSAKFEAFSCWWQIVCRRRYDRELAASLVARNKGNVLERYWRAWQEIYTESQQVRAFQLRQHGRRVLGTLIAYAEYRDTKRARDQAKLDAWATVTTERLLVVWNEVANYRWRLRNSYAMTVSLRNRALLTTVFAFWRDQTEFALSSIAAETGPRGRSPRSPAQSELSGGFQSWVLSKSVAIPQDNRSCDNAQVLVNAHLVAAGKTPSTEQQKKEGSANICDAGFSSTRQHTITSIPRSKPWISGEPDISRFAAAHQTDRCLDSTRTHRKSRSICHVASNSAVARRSEILLRAFVAWRQLVSPAASERGPAGSLKGTSETPLQRRNLTSSQRVSDPHWLETESARMAYKKAHNFRVRTVLGQGFKTWQTFLRTKNGIVKKLQDEFRVVRCMRNWKAAFARRKTLHALAHVQRHYLLDLDHHEPSNRERNG